MTEQAKLFDRAADCERLMDATSDPDEKEAFKQLRDMWIALANESPTMAADDMTKKIADIERLRGGLGPPLTRTSGGSPHPGRLDAAICAFGSR